MDKELTWSQKEVAKLLGKGLTNKEIGAELHLVEGTIKNYVAVIMKAYKVSNRTKVAIIINATQCND